MNQTFTQSTSHRRLATRLALIIAAAMVGLALGATPAQADEFKIGILVDPAVSGSDGSAFMEGFQLAVDQSPDVSHPEGVEGGDHLGSMDVVMVTVDDVTDPEELVSAAVELIESDGVAFVIADVSPEAVAALFGPVTGSEIMLLVMSDTGGSGFSQTPFFFSAAEHPGADVLLGDRAVTFSDEFAARYGETPSAAATRGYIAGRLVDISVEATNRDPSDEVTIAAALLAATGSEPQPVTTEPSTTVATEPSTTVATEPSTEEPVTIEAQPTEAEASSGFPITLVVIAVGLVLIAGFAVRATRR